VKLEEFTSAVKLQKAIKLLRSIIYFENQFRLFMFPHVIINLLHYNCYSYGSSLIQDQVKSLALNSRSGSQLDM
jgi:hypothetical protein